MHLVLSRMERIGSTGVVASRSFQNILSVLYKDGLGRLVEDLVRNCCERIIEGGFIEDWINVRYCFVPRLI